MQIQRTAHVVAVLACLVAFGPSVVPAAAQHGATDGEWRSYGGDKGGTKYSPLDQIDADNFSDLAIAWRWKSVDAYLSKTTAGGSEWWSSLSNIVEQLETETPGLYRRGHPPLISAMQAVPLMVGGVLYFNTALSQGVAVDARTGEAIWVYHPKSYEEGTTTMSVTWRQRGVAYWTDGTEERIFWGTGNGYLICVDAAHGSSVCRLWRRRQGRPDGGAAPRGPKRARLSQRDAILRAIAPHHRS